MTHRTDVLAWLRCEKSTGKPIPDRAIMWLCEHGLKPRDLAFLNGVMSPQQVCNYLKRQMRELNRECDYVMTTWKDYLSMAARLKMDLTSEAVYRVRNVKKRHDELLQFFHTDKSVVLRAGEILKKYPHLEDIFQEIKPKYEFSDQEYTIRVPERIEEIILEGQILSHCVGDSERYWERIEQRESYILFLRRTGETDKPFYTLEIEPNGTIRQKRTLGDEQKEDILQASQFLKKWQKEINGNKNQKECGCRRKPTVDNAHYGYRNAYTCTTICYQIHNGRRGKLHDQHFHCNLAKFFGILIHFDMLCFIRFENFKFAKTLYTVKKAVPHGSIFVPVFCKYFLCVSGYSNDGYGNQWYTCEQYKGYLPVNPYRNDK